MKQSGKKCPYVSVPTPGSPSQEPHRRCCTTGSKPAPGRSAPLLKYHTLPRTKCQVKGINSLLCCNKFGSKTSASNSEYLPVNKYRKMDVKSSATASTCSLSGFLSLRKPPPNMLLPLYSYYNLFSGLPEVVFACKTHHISADYILVICGKKEGHQYKPQILYIWHSF